MNGENKNQEFNRVPPPPIGGLPPPVSPGEEVKIRTMESDVKSVKESGGGAPEPIVINPEDLGIGESASPIAPPPASPPPQVPSPSSPSAPISPPPPAMAFPTAGAPAETKRGLGWLWWTLIIVVIAAAVVLVGWFYVVPLVYSPAGPDALMEGAPAGAPEEGAGEAAPPAVASVSLYESPFGFYNDEIGSVDIDDYTVVGILSALQNAADRIAVNGQAMEVILNIAGQPARFLSYLITLLPELEQTNLAAILEADFDGRLMVLLYRQDDRVWPVYAARRKPETAVDEAALRAQLSVIENSSFSNLFLSPPTGAAVFKTGPVSDKHTSRYASFENKPASFNYGLFGDYLIFSTTYQGLTEALDLLGL